MSFAFSYTWFKCLNNENVFKLSEVALVNLKKNDNDEIVCSYVYFDGPNRGIVLGPADTQNLMSLIEEDLMYESERRDFLIFENDAAKCGCAPMNTDN